MVLISFSYSDLSVFLSFPNEMGLSDAEVEWELYGVTLAI